MPKRIRRKKIWRFHRGFYVSVWAIGIEGSRAHVTISLFAWLFTWKAYTEDGHDWLMLAMPKGEVWSNHLGAFRSNGDGTFEKLPHDYGHVVGRIDDDDSFHWVTPSR